MVECWAQTGSGLLFDLIEPKPQLVDFNIDIAESLSRQARFNGHIRSGVYSVAQHSVMGADALLRETGKIAYAGAFLLHDAHEAYIGDQVTPFTKALSYYSGICGQHDEALRQQIGLNAASRFAANACENGLKLLRRKLDRAIYQAAGIGFPLPPDVAEAIACMDRRMLNTERRQLLGISPKPWPEEIENAKPIRLIGRFSLWPWPRAADEFRDRLQRYIPNLKQTSRAA